MSHPLVDWSLAPPDACVWICEKDRGYWLIYMPPKNSKAELHFGRADAPNFK